MSCCSVCGIELPMIQRDRGVHPGCEPRQLAIDGSPATGTEP